MIIRTTQLIKFETKILENFILKCREFLLLNYPDHFAKDEIIKMDNFILKAISFGEMYEIYHEMNIQKLMAIKMEYQILDYDELPTLLEEILTYPSRDEDTKVNYFHKQIIHSTDSN